MANPLELIGVAVSKGGRAIAEKSPRIAKLFGVASEKGLTVTDKTFLKYIKESGQASRFKVVATSSSRAERRAASKLFEKGDVVQKAGKGGKTMVKDANGEVINLREAAKRVKKDFNVARGKRYSNSVSALKHEGQARYTGKMSRLDPAWTDRFGTIHVSNTSRDLFYDTRTGVYKPLRQAYNELHPRSIPDVRMQLRQLFGDSPLGRFFSNFFERLLNVSSPAFHQTLRPVFRRTAKGAAETAENVGKNAAKAEGASRVAGASARKADSTFERMAQMQSGESTAEGAEKAAEGTKKAADGAKQAEETASGAQSRAWTTVHKETLDQIRAKAGRVLKHRNEEWTRHVQNDPLASKRLRLNSDGTFSFIHKPKGAKEFLSPEEAYEEMLKMRKGTVTKSWEKYVETFNKDGKFVKNTPEAYNSPAARIARKQGKTYFDVEKKEFIAPKEVAKRIKNAEAESVKASTAAKESEKVADKAKVTNGKWSARDQELLDPTKKYSVDEKTLSRMKPDQKDRLRSIQQAEEGFAKRQQGIDELRNAAEKMTDAKQAGERARLLNQAAKEQADLNKQMMANKNAFEALTTEANRSTVSKVVGEMQKMGVKKTAGWAGFLLGGGVLGYSQITGKGLVPTLSPMLFGENGVYGSGRQVLTGQNKPMGEDADTLTQSSQQAATLVANEAGNLGEIAKLKMENWALQARNGVADLSEDAQAKWQAYQEEQALKSQAGQQGTVPEYAANGYVDPGTGQYVDPTQPQVTAASQLSTGNNGSTVSAVNNILGNAAGYVSGGNVMPKDLGLGALALYLTLGRFGTMAKIFGGLLGGSVLHNINNRGQQQQVNQYQRQVQTQAYNPQQAYQQEMQRQQQAVENEPVTHVSRSV